VILEGDDVAEGSGMVAEIKVIGIRKFLRRGFAGLLYSKDGELLRVGTGMGRRRKPLMMLKMEVLTAMPRARVTTARAANQGRLA